MRPSALPSGMIIFGCACREPLPLPWPLASAQESVSFPAGDGGRVCVDLYGRGVRAVLLAHGGRFKKESWRVQANAPGSSGFRVLAIDLWSRLLDGSQAG